MEDPEEPGSNLERAIREVHEPVVQWAVHKAVRR